MLPQDSITRCENDDLYLMINNPVALNQSRKMAAAALLEPKDTIASEQERLEQELHLNKANLQLLKTIAKALFLTVALPPYFMAVEAPKRLIKNIIPKIMVLTTAIAQNINQRLIALQTLVSNKMVEPLRRFGKKWVEAFSRPMTSAYNHLIERFVQFREKMVLKPLNVLQNQLKVAFSKPFTWVKIQIDAQWDQRPTFEKPLKQMAKISAQVIEPINNWLAQTAATINRRISKAANDISEVSKTVAKKAEKAVTSAFQVAMPIIQPVMTWMVPQIQYANDVIKAGKENILQFIQRKFDQLRERMQKWGCDFSRFIAAPTLAFVAYIQRISGRFKNWLKELFLRLWMAFRKACGDRIYAWTIKQMTRLKAKFECLQRIFLQIKDWFVGKILQLKTYLKSIFERVFKRIKAAPRKMIKRSIQIGSTAKTIAIGCLKLSWAVMRWMWLLLRYSIYVLQKSAAESYSGRK